MNDKIKFETIMPIINEAFDKGESFTFKPNGVSMLPFIKGGKTSVTIEKYTGGAQINDVVFYKRDDGKYVLHRIVKIYENGYGVCGDNQWWVEKVNDEQIFAQVKLVEGKKGSGGFLYLKTLFVRRFIIHIKAYIKKHLRGEKK